MYRKLITILLLYLFSATRLNAQVSPHVFFHHPFTDTNLCAGSALIVSDSIEIPYSSGNIFTVQLSNAQGSFANPVAIGSSSAISSGTISCIIPANTITGIGYRIRIIASNPADTSANDGLNIRISNLSALTLTSNSPICAGDTLRINAIDTSAGVVFSYTGPSNFSSTLQNIVFPHSTYSDTGLFAVTASLGVCSITNSIHITLNPKPDTPVQGLSWLSACVGGTLHLTAWTPFSNAIYWNGPDNFNDSFTAPYLITISNAQLADSGVYTAVARIGSCFSDTSHAYAEIHPYRVPSVTITTNPSPIVPGIPTQFTANIINGGYSPTIYWLMNGTTLPFANVNPYTLTITEGDVIGVLIISNLPCPDPDSASASITATTEVSNHFLRTDIKIYPDPITTALFIDAPFKTKCSVSSIDGKELITAYSFSVHDTRPLNTSILSAGVYILRLYDENGVMVKTQLLIK